MTGIEVCFVILIVIGTVIVICYLVPKVAENGGMMMPPKSRNNGTGPNIMPKWSPL